MPARGPAVFLDRDGTVIEDRNYLGDPAGVQLLPGAAAAIARLNRAGIPVVLVTNQSGIGRGYFSEQDYAAVHQRLIACLAEAGAEITAAYHCPHSPDRDPPCECRKPLDGLFRRASEEHGIDLGSSVYVGDRARDVEPGTQAGGRGIIIRAPTSDGERIPPGAEVAADLSEAVERILAEWRND